MNDKNPYQESLNAGGGRVWPPRAVITAVAAVDVNGALGVKGEIPWHIPSEFKHFKEITMGKTLIMGRRTYESIGRALPGRTLHVVSRSLTDAVFPDGVLFYTNLEDAIAEATGSEIIIAGGGEIYQQCMEMVDKIILSIIPTVVDEADTFFPVMEDDMWVLHDEEQFTEFTVKTYVREGR